MALSHVNVLALTLSTAGHGTGSWSPSAITVTTGKKLLVRLMAMSNQDDALAGTDLTISDTQSRTWTSLIASASGDSPGWGYAARMWISNDTTSTSITLTFDAGTFDIHRYVVIVDELTDASATQPGGKGVITDADGDGTGTLTLDATPATTSIIFALAQRSNNTGAAGSITAGTGWTQDGGNSEADWGAWQTQYRTNTTSTSVIWDDLSVGGAPLGAQLLAAEIVSAGGPVITGNPTNVRTSSGQTASFTASATGASSQQWQSNSTGSWVDISGATSTSYTTPTLTAGTAYAVRCVFSDGTFTATTTPADVWTPAITSKPWAGIGLVTNKQRRDLMRAGTIWPRSVALKNIYESAIFGITTSGTTYTISPTGNITFSGTSSFIRGKVFVPTGSLVFSGIVPLIKGKILSVSGSITLSGTTVYSRGRVFLPSGNITFTGNPTISRGRQINPTGSITFSGTNNLIKTKIILPSGQVVFSGAAPITFSGSGGTTYTINPSGNIVFSGTALINRERTYLPSGTIGFSGTNIQIHTHNILPSGAINFTGTSTITLTPAGGGGGGTTTRLPLTFAGTT